MKDFSKIISILDLVECLSTAMDYISPSMCHHQRRVGYIAQNLAEMTDIPIYDQKNVLIAGFLHDCGALSLFEREEALNFDKSDDFSFLRKHAEAGYQLLRKFSPFKDIAHYVRFHHHPWNNGKGMEHNGEEVSICSQLLHLADRIDILINKNHFILLQSEEIIKKINAYSGKLFAPLLVEAFTSLAEKESFWLEIDSIRSGSLWSSYSGLGHIKGDKESLLSMTKLFSHIIDFRSRFTATHSSGVSKCAATLAGLTGMDEDECLMMEIAGNLHDLGKLAVPKEILEKAGKLSKQEFSIIKAHTYYTYKTLKKFRDFDTISRWAANHHERLDGKGYPFHLTAKDLTHGCRIMAVADIFTAITEDRPYRKGMDDQAAIKILQNLVRDNAIDGDIVDILVKNFAECSQVRNTAQQKALKEYLEFEKSIVGL